MAQITGTHYEPPAGGSVFGQSESGDGEMPGKHLVSLLQQVSKGSMGKIDNLIGDLQTLRSKLQTDGDRTQRDITEYADPTDYYYFRECGKTPARSGD